MAPRASWKGFIRLSLISIPVRSFTAHVPASEIHFRQLHRACHSPIRYQKVCPVHGPVDQAEIVSGYEFQKGQFVVIEDEEKEKLLAERDKAINIDGFLRGEPVDPLYFSGKTYYLLPDGPAGQKPYALLQKAMEDKDASAVSRVVLSGREEVALLRPAGRILELAFLRYGDEVKKPEAFEDELTEQRVLDEERRLATTLIDASTRKSIDLSQYRDSYRRRVTELIQAKVEGKEITAPAAEEPKKVINLMEALKQSVAQAQAKDRGGKVAPRRARKSRVPHARATATARGRKKLG